jgi:ubiquinone biosynthesis protein
MKLKSIPQLYRHFNRFREILVVFTKYGFAWITRLGPEFAKDLLKAPGGTAIARLPWETRMRLAISELGPTFIKLGQILSTRPDLVGVGLAEELQHLQEDVAADPPEVVRATIEGELGRPVEELFDQFEDMPIASASIGQCHRATLKTGEPVVVKVQHADIQRRVAVDCDILNGLAQRAERFPEARNYRPRSITAEFQRTIRRELDFTREQRHMEQFARNFADDDRVHIPRAYPEFSTSRVLTMERVEGIRLSETERLAASGLDPEEISRRGANLYMKMVFDHGFYHADPHPGNILLMDGNVIALLDHGMVGRIDERLHEDIEELLLAVAGQDPEHLTSIIVRLGQTPSDLDRASLSVDVADLVAHYGSQSMDQLDVSGALSEMVEIIRRYRIMLPARIAMLIKTLITLEGTSRMASPRFTLIEVIKPYRKKMLMRRLSPRRRLRKIRRFMADVEHLIEAIPQGVLDILEQVQSGKFDVHLDHRGLEPSVNRLVLGLLASALFLGSAWMLAHNVPPTISWLSARPVQEVAEEAAPSEVPGDVDSRAIPPPKDGEATEAPVQKATSDQVAKENAKPAAQSNAPVEATKAPVEHTVREVSILGAAGCILAVFLGLRLLRAINKSGHLDRRDRRDRE